MFKLTVGLSAALLAVWIGTATSPDDLPGACEHVPFSVPQAPQTRAAEPKRSGIIIRVSGVRVPPPA